MDNEPEQPDISEFELDDDDSPYWDFDDQYWDEEDDHDYYDDEEEYHYWCDICDSMDEEPCNEFIHELHDSAKAALDPQLDYWKCGTDGGILKFYRRHNPDFCVSEEYAIAQCCECYQSYTVLHTPDTKRILGVYPGILWHYEGDPNDQPDEVGSTDLPF